MKIYISEFKYALKNIKNDSNNYELVLYDYISIIKNIKNYWNDGYTLSFFNKFNVLINDSDDIINSINKVNNMLEVCYSSYNKLSSEITNNFNYDKNIIYSEMFKISDYNNDKKTTIKKREIYNYISEIEENISILISKVKIPFIENISFNQLDNDDSYQENDFSGMKENVYNLIKKADNTLKNLYKYMVLLCDDLSSLCNYYFPNNQKQFRNLINNCIDNFKFSYLNEKNAFLYIVDRANKYSDGINYLLEDTAHILYNEEK